MKLLDSLNVLTKELVTADELCVPNNSKSSSLSSILKDLYDTSVTTFERKVGPFDELIVKDLDIESIWEEINTRNKPLTRILDQRIVKLKQKNVSDRLSASSDDSEQEEYDIRGDDGEGVDDEDEEEDNEDSEDNDVNASHNESDESDVDDHELSNADNSGENDLDINADEIDDDFGDKMDAWLDKTEEQEERHYQKMMRRDKKDGHKGAESDEESDNDSEDDMLFVQQQLYDEDGEGSDDAAAEYRYQDFFVSEDDKQPGNKGTKQKKKQAKIDSESEDEDEDGAFGSEEDGDEAEQDWEGEDDFREDSEEEEEESNAANTQQMPKKPLTSFQNRSLQLSTQIAELEQELVSGKSWEMRGEVKAAERPENSLLGISADIERSSKPAPVITQDFTSSLEDLIRRRIKDDKFDDVAPKAASSGRSRASGDAEVELSQEKSRVGLGEIYAEEFLARSLNAQPEAVSKKLEAAREEALSLYHKISMQLDGLSHFYFTPRPVVAEAKISSLGAVALSSLEMEDVAPLVQSAASQLAPEQVAEKRKGRDGALLSKEELTSDDRRRLRRARKAAGKHSDGESEDEAKAKRQRRAKEERSLDEELRKDKRVVLQPKNGGGSVQRHSEDGVDGGSATAFSKSASFFSKLQQHAQKEISGSAVDASKAGKGKKSSSAAVSSSSGNFKL